MTTRRLFNFKAAHPSWHTCLHSALGKMDNDYLESLYRNSDWLPGHQHIFSAFSIPLHQVKWALFGESPYPRPASANGYAFWDGAVNTLWSDTGLDKAVNRATSLRNLLKTLLIAEGLLHPEHTGQPDIQNINKSALVKTCAQLFGNFLKRGFLLLNATPVLRKDKVRQDAAAFQPFIKEIIVFIAKNLPKTQLILWGRIAAILEEITDTLPLAKIVSEHPYNLSFLRNPDIMRLFQPLHLILL